MRTFRRPLTTVAALTTLIVPASISACSNPAANNTANAPLTVIASASPHAEILEWIDEQDDSFTLDVAIATDGAGSNVAVENGSADANFFQHLPYLRDWEAQTGKTLANVASVHIEPMALYSEKVTDIAQFPDGATITVPASPSNLARALLLLEANGLIELDADLDPEAVSSIDLTRVSANPHKLTIVPIEDILVIRSVHDAEVHGTIASTNYALEAGYDPTDDALITESAENNPYTNIFVTSTATQDDPRVQAVITQLTSHATAAWIRETYGNAVIPITR